MRPEDKLPRGRHSELVHKTVLGFNHEMKDTKNGKFY